MSWMKAWTWAHPSKPCSTIGSHSPSRLRDEREEVVGIEIVRRPFIVLILKPLIPNVIDAYCKDELYQTQVGSTLTFGMAWRVLGIVVVKVVVKGV